MISRFAPPLAFMASLSLIPPGAFADDKKNDPEEIGNRDVGKGVNFYSIRKKLRSASNWRRKWSGNPRSSTTR